VHEIISLKLRQEEVSVMTKEELKELRNEWETRISEFKTSGQSQAAWCREKNINQRTFNYWYRKLKNTSSSEENTTNWLSMKLERRFEHPEASAINIKLGNAIIETKPEFNTEHLLKIIRTLSSLC
jgi:hypothetical protein